MGGEIKNYSKVFEDTKTFAYNSDCYKGNIYTLSFPEEKDHLFLKEHQELTGCNTKNEYKQLHRTHRFPMLSNWTKVHKPKIIVCFGISQSYIEDYYLAFSGKKHSTADTQIEIVGDTNFRYGLLNDKKTLLVIAPFIGHYKYCLNSDERLMDVGKSISKLCRNHFGDNWCRFQQIK